MEHGQEEGQQLKYDNFDGDVYLKAFYEGKLECNSCFLHSYGEFYSQFSDASIELLNFGAGPTILQLIASARKLSRYVHADYGKMNRAIVERWWKNEPGAFDWREYIRYYLKFEGRSGTDEEVAEREESMRRLTEAVVYCDVFADEVMPRGYEGPYDVVCSLSCLDWICTSTEALGRSIEKLSRLLKNGGYLMLECSIAAEDHGLPERGVDNMDECHVIHTKPGYIPCNHAIGGFKYDGQLVENLTTYKKLMQSCGLTMVHQYEYKYNDPANHYTDIIAIMIGKKP